MNTSVGVVPPVARINGVPLHMPEQPVTAEELRQRACTELLRQEAQGAGLLDASDPFTVDGLISEAASAAIPGVRPSRRTAPESRSQVWVAVLQTTKASRQNRE